MYLTFKDKHDSNVTQRDVWYKKEKCCFDFLYHNRLSLSSTLCGEEPIFCDEATKGARAAVGVFNDGFATDDFFHMFQSLR